MNMIACKIFCFAFYVFYSTLRKKCPYSELLCSVFSRIRTEYGEIQSISPYSVQMREKADQNNSEYEHFSRMLPLIVKNCQNCGCDLLYLSTKTS